MLIFAVNEVLSKFENKFKHLFPTHREIDSESCELKPNLHFHWTFPIDFLLHFSDRFVIGLLRLIQQKNGIEFGAKSIGKVYFWGLNFNKDLYKIIEQNEFTLLKQFAIFFLPFFL